MSPELINKITNWIAAFLVIIEPVNAYLTSQPFNWGTFLMCLGGSVIAYFTGKSALALKAK